VDIDAQLLRLESGEKEASIEQDRSPDRTDGHHSTESLGVK
jgi:hypothetical protein